MGFYENDKSAEVHRDRMKKKPWILITLLIAATIIFLLGFGLYSVSSLPFQDPELISGSILEKQARDIIVGKIVMLIGATLLFGTIIWQFFVSRRR